MLISYVTDPKNLFAPLVKRMWSEARTPPTENQTSTSAADVTRCKDLSLTAYVTDPKLRFVPW